MAKRSAEQLALGRAIRELREEIGLTQEGLGLKVGLDRTYIGGIERGERNPSYASLRRLAAGLNCRASQVLARAEGN